MGIVKFGTKQLNNPTPHKISLLCDFLAAFFGIVGAYLTTASFVSHTISDPISSILTGLMIPVILLVKRFFGVTQTEETVSVEDVNEIETPKDK